MKTETLPPSGHDGHDTTTVTIMYGIFTLCNTECGEFAQLMCDDEPVQFETIMEAERFLEEVGLIEDVTIRPISDVFGNPSKAKH